jgi:3-oxo-5-alpha-steroid 4-dehydrogenase 1
MQPHPVFAALLAAWVLVGVIAFLALMRIPAPYGRFERPGWGPEISPRLGWFLMESPGVFIFAGILLVSLPVSLVPALFGVLWLVHYFYRGFFYPLLLRSTRRIPVAIIVSAIGFHLANVTFQAWELYRVRPDRPLSWLRDPRFLTGLALFACGCAIATRADARLRALRPARGQEYLIPRGGMFEYVSCPNYFGEIVEWIGWAVLTWTWAGAAFALWTIANLLPRALALHRWYRAQFADYPPDRKALVPHVL